MDKQPKSATDNQWASTAKVQGNAGQQQGSQKSNANAKDGSK